MISFRRAALLGLNAPLSSIMLAVLGLWPEADEPVIEIPTSTADPRGGGKPAPRQASPKAKPDTRLDDEFIAAKRAQQMAQNRAAIIATLIGAAEEYYA